MTPIADVAFVASVLNLYLDLPDTPIRYNSADQSLAQRLHEQQVSLPVIEAALLLASLRRLLRPQALPPLPRIRSLAYFQPVIDELLQQPLPDSYLQYLRLKLRSVSSSPSAAVQKTTLLRDR
jgi:hypothetical protein